MSQMFVNDRMVKSFIPRVYINHKGQFLQCLQTWIQAPLWALGLLNGVIIPLQPISFSAL